MIGVDRNPHPELARNGFLGRATPDECTHMLGQLDRLMVDATGYKRQDLVDARDAIAALAGPGGGGTPDPRGGTLPP